MVNQIGGNVPTDAQPVCKITLPQLTMTTLRTFLSFSIGSALLASLLGTARASPASRDLSTYVLFANDGIRARGLGS